MSHMLADLVHTASEPPQQAPGGQYAPDHRLQFIGPVAVTEDDAGTDQRRETEQQASQADAVQHRQIACRQRDLREEGCAGSKLQQDAEAAHQAALLAETGPYHGGPFQRPDRRCPSSVEGQRDRQGQEDRAKGEEGLGQRAHHLFTAQQCAGQGQVDKAGGQGAPGQTIAELFHQPGLQGKGRDRRAEHQRSVQHPLQIGRLTEGEQHRHGDIHQEEEHQERLHNGKVRWLVEPSTPDRTDQKGIDKTGQVERTPGAEPGHADDAGVEHQVVAEQWSRIVCADGGQQRCNKAARNAEQGQGA